MEVDQRNSEYILIEKDAATDPNISSSECSDIGEEPHASQTSHFPPPPPFPLSRPCSPDNLAESYGFCVISLSDCDAPPNLGSPDVLFDGRDQKLQRRVTPSDSEKEEAKELAKGVSVGEWQERGDSVRSAQSFWDWMEEDVRDEGTQVWMREDA
uniref:Uncharacterized protein n=1 Tax=Euplotes harpa TaxID=151035 RepID=A0A7S3JCE0_9SPIT|mmetsp:Transcript_29694/g.34022  ORF Transcript_29694/g.34022 Transcript_29694/m.34022 type:complete len:155 (+) Transcript_29694:16-480(+)